MDEVQISVSRTAIKVKVFCGKCIRIKTTDTFDCTVKQNVDEDNVAILISKLQKSIPTHSSCVLKTSGGFVVSFHKTENRIIYTTCNDYDTKSRHGYTGVSHQALSEGP